MVCFFHFGTYAGAQNERNVYIIPIKGEINPAVTQFVKSSIQKAQEDPNGVAIIFEIDTLGGMVNEAIKIRDEIFKTPLHTISFVNKKAESAGVLLTISSDEIVMAKGSTIGSAETIPYTEKNISYWKGELRATAQEKGRDPLLVEAMADRRIEIVDQNDSEEYVVKEGELLNLTTNEAQNLGFTDLISNNYEEILSAFDVEYSKIIPIEQSIKIKMTQWVASSLVLPILLSAGFIGIIVELFVPGFGIGGTIGFISFAVFFWGSVLAGNTSVAIILLFVTGIFLLLIEVFAPGFGAPGIGGLICIVISIIISSESIALGLSSLGIAFFLAILAVILLLKYAPKNKYFDKIILGMELKKDKGFVSTETKENLLGLEGLVISSLRPSGAVEVGGQKIDVVTEGEFIEPGSRVKIIKVEGRKIVVRKIKG